VDRRLGVLVPALAVLAMLLAPVSSAYASGVVYLPPKASFKATYEKTIVDAMQFSVNANSTKSIDLRNYTLPGSIDAVIVKIDQASGSAKLMAKDENGTAVATADIIPLSSGYTVTLPGTTRVIDIQNLATSVWEGVITITIKSSMEAELVFQQSSITIQNGVGIANAQIVVKSLPEGSLSLSVAEVSPYPGVLWEAKFMDPNDVDNDGKTSNDEFIYQPGHNDPNNPATYNVQVKIQVGNTAPGTYTAELRMWLHEGVQLDVDPPNPSDQPVKLGDVTLTVALQDDQSGSATVAPPEEDNTIAGIPLKWAVAGLFFLLLVFLFFKK